MGSPIGRLLLIILLPGIAAIAPWFALLVPDMGRVKDYSSAPSSMVLILPGLATVTGLFLKAMADAVVRWWNWRREKKYRVKEGIRHLVTLEQRRGRVCSLGVLTLDLQMRLYLSFAFATPLMIFPIGDRFGRLFPNYAYPSMAAGLFFIFLFTPILFWLKAGTAHKRLCETRMDFINATNASGEGGAGRGADMAAEMAEATDAAKA